MKAFKRLSKNEIIYSISLTLNKNMYHYGNFLHNRHLGELYSCKS